MLERCFVSVLGHHVGPAQGIGALFIIGGRTVMADQHQVNSIIATAICDARKDHPEHRMKPDEAKQIAKCIIEALTDAGLQIVPVSS